MRLLLKEFKRISLKKKIISEECLRSEKTTKYIGKTKKKMCTKISNVVKKMNRTKLDSNTMERVDDQKQCLKLFVLFRQGIKILAFDLSSKVCM